MKHERRIAVVTQGELAERVEQRTAWLLAGEADGPLASRPEALRYAARVLVNAELGAIGETRFRQMLTLEREARRAMVDRLTRYMQEARQ